MFRVGVTHKVSITTHTGAPAFWRLFPSDFAVNSTHPGRVNRAAAGVEYEWDPRILEVLQGDAHCCRTGHSRGAKAGPSSPRQFRVVSHEAVSERLVRNTRTRGMSRGGVFRRLLLSPRFRSNQADDY